jgi:NAD(P)-dependent dehydrogenase (short-subunit alcohol dehydrogenase family)
MTLAAQRRAAVTGGASGIGLAVARRLVAEGAAVALLDVQRERLEAAARSSGTARSASPQT